MGKAAQRAQKGEPPAKALKQRRLRRGFVDKSARRGPLTAAGKARSSQNARRHGFSAPGRYDAADSAAIDAMARDICRSCGIPDESPEAAARHAATCLDLARQIAGAQHDLDRVRRARHTHIMRAFANPYWRPAAGLHAYIHLLGKVGSLLRHGLPVPPHMRNAILIKPKGDHKLALILCDEIARLCAMDRYESHALSRRRDAMDAFDEARAAWAERVRAGQAKERAKKKQAQDERAAAERCEQEADGGQPILAKRNTPKSGRPCKDLPEPRVTRAKIVAVPSRSSRSTRHCAHLSEIAGDIKAFTPVCDGLCPATATPSAAKLVGNAATPLRLANRTRGSPDLVCSG
jgi:hypothetical protein